MTRITSRASCEAKYVMKILERKNIDTLWFNKDDKGTGLTDPPKSARPQNCYILGVGFLRQIDLCASNVTLWPNVWTSKRVIENTRTCKEKGGDDLQSR